MNFIARLSVFWFCFLVCWESALYANWQAHGRVTLTSGVDGVETAADRILAWPRFMHGLPSLSLCSSNHCISHREGQEPERKMQKQMLQQLSNGCDIQGPFDDAYSVLTLHQCSRSYSAGCLRFQRCSILAGRSSEATRRAAKAEASPLYC